MRSTYKIINEEYPHFITSTIVNWINVFSSEVYNRIMMNNFRFYQKQYKIEVIAFVIMPNHFHMVCSCRKLKGAIQALKSYTAKEILRQLIKDKNENILNRLSESKPDYKVESTYQVWQESYHPLLIKDYAMLKQKIEYIHYNPVRKGLVVNAEEWKYSSARFYLKDEECGLEISPYF